MMKVSRSLRLGLISLLGSIVLAVSAAAHSTKESTVPADGAILTAPPATVEMRFDSPMRITMITVTDQDGESYPLARDKSLAARETFIARPETLPAGQYRVEWRGLAEDGHAMQGEFSFTVQ